MTEARLGRTNIDTVLLSGAGSCPQKCPIAENPDTYRCERYNGDVVITCLCGINKYTLDEVIQLAACFIN